MQVAAIVISICALVISIATAWRAHLGPPRMRVVVGSGILWMERIEQLDDSWLLPHITVPITVINLGARNGYAFDIRLVARYPNNPASDAWEVLHLLHETDPSESGDDLGPGVPVAVGPREAVTKHLIFMTRWDYEIEESDAEVDVQVKFGEHRDWRTCKTFPLPPMTRDFWGTVLRGDRYVLSADSNGSGAFERRPVDLHLRSPKEPPDGNVI